VVVRHKYLVLPEYGDGVWCAEIFVCDCADMRCGILGRDEAEDFDAAATRCMVDCVECVAWAVEFDA
jgi:hypothetical protein